MATKPEKNDGGENRQMRLNLIDLGRDEERPNMTVAALDSSLQTIYATDVDTGGSFYITRRRFWIKRTAS